MEALYLILTGILPLVGGLFGMWFGAKLGQKLGKGEEIEAPHPIQTWQEHHAQREARKEAQREADKVNAILENIDSYDGTGANQRDVPR
jgi:thiaminase